MPLVQAQKDARMYLDDDFHLNQVSEDALGRKGYSLFQLRELDVPVPAFFVASASFFSEYIAAVVGTTTDMNSLDAVSKKIRQSSLPKELHDEIASGYSRLSGFADSWVAVRSSIVLPATHRHLSFAGLLDTSLNVRGIEDVTEAVKKIYSSAFTAKVAQYLTPHGLTIADIKVAIVVQKMIQAEVSGITFTVDPISQDPDYLTVEAVFGLGDVIARGEITPDQYTLHKKTNEFREKRIVPQDWMMVRKVRHKKGENGEQKIKISKAWQHHQKIDNKFIIELAKIAQRIEVDLGEPQDIEWVFESGRIWLLQTREIEPVTIPKIDTEQPVPVDKKIVEAAIWGPSVHGLQPGKYVPIIETSCARNSRTISPSKPNSTTRRETHPYGYRGK